MSHAYPLGPFQYRFLCAVKSLGAHAYGIKILSWLEKDTGVQINVGQVYQGAKRLVQRGLIASKTVNVRAGKRPALVYSLTELGEAELAQAAEEYKSLIKLHRARR